MDQSFTELDSHADTCTFGRGAYVLQDTNETISVNPFDSSLGTLHNVPIVTAALAYQDPISLETYILCFPQSLYIESLDTNLLCPLQLRNNGVTIFETPLQFLHPNDRTTESHSIIYDDGIHHLHIPLELNGVISRFHTRKPLPNEIADEDRFPKLWMTNSRQWDPYDPTFEHVENELRELSYNPVREDRNRSISAVDRYLRSVCFADNFIQRLEASVRISSMNIDSKRKRKGFVSSIDLAKRWHVGLDAAKRTLDRTTQLAVRDFTLTQGGRRLKPTAYQLKHRRLNTPMYTDTMFAKTKSLRQNTCAQIYATDFQWSKVYPLRSKADAHLSLDSLFSRVGIPKRMIPDNAPELVQGDFKRKLLRASVDIKPVEAYSPNQNLAETCIRELKRTYRKLMKSTNCPAILWDFAFEYVADVRAHTAHPLHALQGDVPQTVLLGDTADISHLCEFGFYDFIWYITPADQNLEVKLLGRYLGPSHDVGEAMCAYVLTSKGQVVSRTSVFPLSIADQNSEPVKAKKEAFMKTLSEKFGDRLAGEIFEDDEPDEFPDNVRYEDDEPAQVEDTIEIDDFGEEDAYDRYVSAKVLLPSGDELLYGTVRSRKRDADGRPIGRGHTNPILDTTMYEVEFEDGRVEAYHANKIAESIYARIDDQGFTKFYLDEIIDHQKGGDAVTMDNATFTLNNRVLPKRTTRGWKLLVRWKDGTTSWESLKELKESNPLEVAEYAVANNIASEPAFAWWVPYTLKKRDRVIKAVKNRYSRTYQKFGIELPKTVERALEIDGETGTTFWRDAIQKEMKAVLPAFEILDDPNTNLVGYSEISTHLVFDVKMDFTRKARFVANPHGGDGTAPDVVKSSPINTYASVVSRESVRIAFLLAALNDLDLMAADIANAYLNAPCREKIYITCGIEFGDNNRGKKAKIVKALYGLFSSGASWRSLISETLQVNLGFMPCRADADVWLRPAEKADGTKYYEYVLVYTDDLLVLSTDPKTILNHLDQHFLLKKGSVGEPKTYLGADIHKHVLPDRANKTRWAMSATTYVKNAVNNVSNYLSDRGLTLKSKAPTVLPSGYSPELDVSELCNDTDANYFQQLIGVLRWATELGRVDICCEVSMMAAFSAAPRVGHLQAVFHIFAYLKQHGRSKIVFDDSYVDMPVPNLPDWADFYPYAKEEIPFDAPEPRGKAVQSLTFCDSDHAGDKVTRRSRTGILLFVNRALVNWFSKKQNSVETSTFGSEFMALKTAMEMVIGLRYKLRMMGVPIEGPTRFCVDNMSVVNNTSIPSSTLKKKSNSIAYHFVREKIAARVGYVTYEPTDTNLADILTKQQSGPKRTQLASMILH